MQEYEGEGMGVGVLVGAGVGVGRQEHVGSCGQFAFLQNVIYIG